MYLQVSLKNACSAGYAEDNCMFSVLLERKNLFTHLETVSKVLSFALHVKVFLCLLLTVSRGVCHSQPTRQYLTRHMVNWTKLFWIDLLLYKNKTSHKDP